MNNIWLGFALRLAAVALAALLVWPVAGAVQALGLALLAVLLMLLHHVRHLARLSKWMADPRPEAQPDSSGLWEDVFAAFYHLLRRQRRSESGLRTSGRLLGRSTRRCT